VRQLTNTQVDRLLAYLAKWVSRYSQGPLAQMAHATSTAGGLLPHTLTFPAFSQVCVCVFVCMFVLVYVCMCVFV